MEGIRASKVYVIVEETIQRAYIIDVEDDTKLHELDALGDRVFDPPPAQPPIIGKRVANMPACPPISWPVAEEARRLKSLTVLLAGPDGVPFNELKRTGKTIVRKPVKR